MQRNHATEMCFIKMQPKMHTVPFEGAPWKYFIQHCQINNFGQ